MMQPIYFTLTTRRLTALWLLLAGLLLAACGSPTQPATAPTVDAPTVQATAVAEEATAQTDPVATPVPTGETEAAAAGDAQVMVVIQLDEQRLLVREVRFTPPISGLAALEAGGVPVVTIDTDWGAAVCAVADVGCPVDDCFCGGDNFWNYAFWDGAAWEGYPVGAGQSRLEQDGSVEGWRWGAFDQPALAPARAQAAQAAIAYLLAQQQGDGSIGGVGGSVEVMMALGANRIDPATLRPAAGGASLLAQVVEHGPAYSTEGVAAAGKLAVALSTADACWPAGALTPPDYADPETGLMSEDAGFLAWALLGSYALDLAPPAANVQALLDLALDEGGWEWSPGWGADSNTTAVALQALAAAGVDADEPAVVAGLAFLAAVQSDEGGFSYALDDGGRGLADANSTAYAVQALLAWGADVGAPEWQRAQGGPLEFLMARQDESGALGWQASYPDANLLATTQAIPALLGHAYPVRMVALPACGE